MPPDPQDIVDLTGSPSVAGGGTPPAERSTAFLRVLFECSNQYTRAYRNADGTEYSARCAQCGKAMRFAIGPGGTSQRAFTVTCR